jgi:hypothetical protein
MRSPSVRVLVAIALAVATLGVAASGVFASSQLASCSLVAREGDAPEQLGTILESVAVTGTDDVWAVGSHVVGGGSSAYAERWDGSAWVRQALAVPPGHTSISSLYDVKAFGPDDVWAVGSIKGEDPLIQHWDGTAWSAVEAPELVGTERILTAIDGTSDTDLWVVGQQWVANQERGVVLHRTDAGWVVVPAPSGTAVLHDVAVLQPGTPLVAGWSIDEQGYAAALLATRDGDRWVREQVPAAPERNVFLIGLALARPGAAWAVGFSNDSPNGDAPVTLRRGADGWREVAVPDLGGSVRLLSVTTGDAGTVAVGQVSSEGVSRALALRAEGDGWGQIPGAGEEPPDSLAGVALAGHDVWAVGKRVVTGGTYGIPAARVYSCGS